MMYTFYGMRSFRQRLVHQRLRSIRQRSKSPCQRPTGQFANVRYLVLTEKKLLIDVCFGENWLLNTKVRWLPNMKYLEGQKNLWNLLQNLIKTYIYLSEINLSYL